MVMLLAQKRLAVSSMVCSCIPTSICLGFCVCINYIMLWYSQRRTVSILITIVVPPPPTCPPDKPRVNCFVDPCQFAKCPAHPNAKCVSDYCGGCNARFFDGGKEVTDTCGELHYT